MSHSLFVFENSFFPSMEERMVRLVMVVNSEDRKEYGLRNEAHYENTY